jgi:hypothetical protein
MQNVVCAFCGKKTVPKADKTLSNVVKYRCDNCESLIAAYANEFEGDLLWGNLFEKYSSDMYTPKLPPYVKTVDRRSSE